jgi:hypothetical protein
MKDKLQPWIMVRVTLEDGASWETEIRGPINAFRRYYMQNGGYTDYGSDPEGKEIVRRIVSVEQISSELIEA